MDINSITSIYRESRTMDYRYKLLMLLNSSKELFSYYLEIFTIYVVDLKKQEVVEWPKVIVCPDY